MVYAHIDLPNVDATDMGAAAVVWLETLHRFDAAVQRKKRHSSSEIGVVAFILGSLCAGVRYMIKPSRTSSRSWTHVIPRSDGGRQEVACTGPRDVDESCRNARRGAYKAPVD